MPNNEEMNHWIRALKEFDWRVRYDAAEALGKLKDPRAVAPLVQALQDEENDVRRAAVRALGQIGDMRAIPPLVQVLQDRHGGVREAAAAALNRLDWAPATKREQVQYLIAYSRWNDVAQVGEAAVAPLIQELRSGGGYKVHNNAAWTLGVIGEPAIQPLLQIMENPEEEWWVQDNALEALLEIVKRFPRDERVYNQVITPLIQAFQKGVEEVLFERIQSALAQIGSPAVPSLLQALQNPNYHIRWGATHTLGELGDLHVVPSLIQVLQHDWEIREAAARALGELGDRRAVPPLIQVLQHDEERYYRSIAAWALGQIGDGRALASLTQALQDNEENVRWSAVNALGALGDPRAIEPLTQALSDASRNVRMAAQDALAKLQAKKQEE